MFRTCLVAFLIVIAVADVQEDGVRVAEIGVRSIKAHGSLAEKTTQSLMRRDPLSLSPAVDHAAHADAKNAQADAEKAATKMAVKEKSSVKLEPAAKAKSKAAAKNKDEAHASTKTAVHEKSWSEQVQERAATIARETAKAKARAQAEEARQEREEAEARSRARATQKDLTVMSTHMYEDAVSKHKPVCFWPFNTPDGLQVRGSGISAACGPEGIEYGDDCQCDGHINPGAPCELQAGCLFPVCGRFDNSIKFLGNQYMKVNTQPLINSQKEGYREKTVEMWIEPDEIDEHPRIVFAMGQGTKSGISMYVKKEGENTTAKRKLFMFAWNLVEGESPDPRYGEFDPRINAEPLSCEIQEKEAYHIAFVFNSTAMKYTGYIKHKDDDKIHECGKVAGLPLNSLLEDMEGGHPCFANADYETRLNAADLINYNIEEGPQEKNGFLGKICCAAIYNEALHPDELQEHNDASNGVIPGSNQQ